MERKKITVEATVRRPIGTVWETWTVPAHIMAWNNASADWYTPAAEIDLRKGGTFKYRMAARDNSHGFDFGGTYDDVIVNKRIVYTMDDGRKVVVDFAELDGSVKVTETFEAEGTYSLEHQRAGWQAILDNFRRYTETG